MPKELPHLVNKARMIMILTAPESLNRKRTYKIWSQALSAFKRTKIVNQVQHKKPSVGLRGWTLHFLDSGGAGM